MPYKLKFITITAEYSASQIKGKKVGHNIILVLAQGTLTFNKETLVAHLLGNKYLGARLKNSTQYSHYFDVLVMHIGLWVVRY